MFRYGSIVKTVRLTILSEDHNVVCEFHVKRGFKVWIVTG